MPAAPKLPYDEFITNATPIELVGADLDFEPGESIATFEHAPGAFRAYWVVAPRGRAKGKYQPMRNNVSGHVFADTSLRDLTDAVNKWAARGEIMDHSLGRPRREPVFEFETRGDLITGFSIADGGGRGRSTETVDAEAVDALSG